MVISSVAQAIGLDPPLFGFEWNQINAPAEAENLVLLLAYDRDGNLSTVGTGFIVHGQGRTAFCISAAHNFTHIRDKLQQRRPLHHPSALPMFLPPPKLHIGQDHVIAVCTEGGKPATANVVGAAFVEAADIAVFRLELQEPHAADGSYFASQLAPSDQVPAVGAVVGVIGYCEHKIEEITDDRVTVNRMLTCRIGRVVQHHPTGHMLCRGPCLETTIPTYGGMSGGPAFVYNHRPDGFHINPFGVICHADVPADIEDHLDRSKPSNTVIALLPLTVTEVDSRTRQFTLALRTPVAQAGAIGGDLGAQPARPAPPEDGVVPRA